MSGIKEALKKIEDQASGRNNEDVDELVLDQCQIEKFTPELTKALEKFENLFFVSLNDCGLTSLDNLPNLTKLIRFELTDNKIPGASLANLSKLVSLQSLSIGGNPISSLDDLKPLTKLEKLVQLDLFGSPLSEQDGYREKVFGMFSGLQILDNKDADGEEVEYAEEEEGEDEEDDEEEYDDEEFEEEEEEDDEEDDEEEDYKAGQKKKQKK
mmetsp:Transcript_17444/g.19862  ORF Transcript_17444/g.19862 Transcript_17444/m.19862 type:complete len:212 (-) Transcript_17444:167-802(-)